MSAGGDPQILPQPLSPCPARPAGGAGVQNVHFPLLCSASAKAPSMEDLWQLPDIDSVGTHSSSVSVSSGSSYYIDTPEGRIRMPKVCSVGSPSSRGSASSGSSYYIDTPEDRIQMPKICSPGPFLSSSSRSTDTLLERRLAAMSEQVAAQERSGPAQSPEDDQGLVARAGSDETLPKERPQPPTCREVEAKLRQPGDKMWLNGQRVELPRGLLDTDEAVDGDQIRRNNVAPDRSARLWQCLKACWQWCLQSCCCYCFPKPPR